MVIPAAMRDEIVAHARAGLPNEACGIIAGRDGRAERFFPAQPDEPSPYYYRIESRDQIRIMNEIDDAGLDLIGIYHSHVVLAGLPLAHRRRAGLLAGRGLRDRLAGRRRRDVKGSGSRAYRIADLEISGKSRSRSSSRALGPTARPRAWPAPPAVPRTRSPARSRSSCARPSPARGSPRSTCSSAGVDSARTFSSSALLAGDVVALLDPRHRRRTAPRAGRAARPSARRR